MRERVKRAAALLWAAVWLAAAAIPAAGAKETVAVATAEDLLDIARDPAGSYVLTADIDMAGQEWTPLDFTGKLDGGGHAILNLELTAPGAGRATTYDGNYKEYDTAFVGLFGTLKGAEVTDLELVNVRARVNADQPCFVGAVAGYSQDSVIRGCHVTGTLELTAYDRMFGVGGVVGYGSGRIEDTGAEVTLVCTDTDVANRDEQFMGGAYAAGHMDLVGCGVDIDGYISDHGYVHSGGLVGMYIFYPKGLSYRGTVTDNTVSGKITFFEDNTNRRAYCDGFIGEIMNWDFENGRNKTGAFVRDEVFDYTRDLKPEMCTMPSYTGTVTPPTCDAFGYTTVRCGGCGYTYTDDYVLKTHTVTSWTVTTAPTTQAQGVQQGTCDLCGAVVEEPVERLAPATPAPSAAPTAPPAETGRWAGGVESLLVLGGVGVLAAVLVVWAIVAAKRGADQ